MMFRFILLICIPVLVIAQAETSNKKTNLKKKSIVDFDDADVERLYEQWEENDDEKLPEDELPEHQRKPPKLDIDSFAGKSVDEIKFLAKKGKSLMIFVRVSENPTRNEAEKLTTLWQTSLFNANYEVTRYMVDDDRAIFMVKDGAYAWHIKEFLIKQERCLDVTIDNEVFPGLHARKSDL